MSGQQQQSGEGGGGGTGYPNYSTYSQSYFQQQEQQQLRQQQTLPDQAHSSQPEGNPDEMILADKVHSSSQPEGTELNYLQRQQERFKQQVLQQQQQQETATPGVAYQGGYNNLATHAQSSQYKGYNTPQYYYGQQQQSSNTPTASGQQVFNTQQPSPVSYGSGQHRQQQQQYYNNSYNTTTNAAYTNYPNNNNQQQHSPQYAYASTYPSSNSNTMNMATPSPRNAWMLVPAQPSSVTGYHQTPPQQQQQPRIGMGSNYNPIIVNNADSSSSVGRPTNHAQLLNHQYRQGGGTGEYASFTTVSAAGCQTSPTRKDLSKKIVVSTSSSQPIESYTAANGGGGAPCSSATELAAEAASTMLGLALDRLDTDLDTMATSKTQTVVAASTTTTAMGDNSSQVTDARSDLISVGALVATVEPSARPNVVDVRQPQSLVAQNNNGGSNGGKPSVKQIPAVVPVNKSMNENDAAAAADDDDTVYPPTSNASKSSVKMNSSENNDNAKRKMKKPAKAKMATVSTASAGCQTSPSRKDLSKEPRIIVASSGVKPIASTPSTVASSGDNRTASTSSAKGKSAVKPTSTTTSPAKKGSRGSCGKCKACLREDCGECRQCKDKKKFGGPNKMRQRCCLRVCQNSIVNNGGGGGESTSRNATAATPHPQPPKKIVKPTPTTPTAAAAEPATVEKTVDKTSKAYLTSLLTKSKSSKHSTTTPSKFTKAKATTPKSAAATMHTEISLPPIFSPEHTFRATAAYSLLRTLSNELRLSPFTLQAFTNALMLPLPSKLLGEIHVRVLRILFANGGMGRDWGTYAKFGDGGLEKITRKKRTSKTDVPHDKLRVGGTSNDLVQDGDMELITKRGGNNLYFLDTTTWPLFYQDYALATEDTFRDIMNEGGRDGDENGVNEEFINVKSIAMQPLEDIDLNPTTCCPRLSGSLKISTGKPQWVNQCPAGPLGARNAAGRFVCCPFHISSAVQMFRSMQPPSAMPASTTNTNGGKKNEKKKSAKKKLKNKGGKRKRGRPRKSDYSSSSSGSEFSEASGDDDDDDDDFPSPAKKKKRPKSTGSIGHSPTSGIRGSRVLGVEMAPPSPNNKVLPVSSLTNNSSVGGGLPPTNKSIVAGGSQMLPPPPVTKPPSGTTSILANDIRGGGEETTAKTATAAPKVDADMQRRIALARAKAGYTAPADKQPIASSSSSNGSSVSMTKPVAIPSRSIPQKSNNQAPMMASIQRTAPPPQRQHVKPVHPPQRQAHQQPPNPRAFPPIVVPPIPLPNDKNALTVSNQVAQSLEHYFSKGPSSSTPAATVPKNKCDASQYDTNALDTHPVSSFSADHLLSHLAPITQLSKGTPYHALSLSSKLSMIEFLLDELLQVPEISYVFTQRDLATSQFTSLYGTPPLPHEYEEMYNADECTVCGIEGDLLCCDGCPGSYHKACM